jgi:hypothetical protein
MPAFNDNHFATVAKALTDGRVIPLLGAGVNLFNRPANTPWQPGQSQFLPSGAELARHLASSYGFPDSATSDLARVSQFVRTVAGSGPLYEELRALLNADFPPTPLHTFLALFPAFLRERGVAPKPQLIVTTNYDDVMERALDAAGESYDVVTYLAEGQARGKFLHRAPGAEPCIIDRPNEYAGLAIDERRNLKRTVVLKLHGAVDRIVSDRDSFVITEDDYIDYLTRTDISNLVPVILGEKLRRSHFLFLGYGLRDWNLRVILHRIWGEQRLTYKSWAIQVNPDQLETRFWRDRDVEILDLPLSEYLARLQEQLSGVPASG